MKTASQRQAEYQKRRLETESRIVIWLDKQTEALMDQARGKEPRQAWLAQVIKEALERPVEAPVGIGEALKRMREKKWP